MAILQTEATYFRGGIGALGACVGYEAGPSRASVARFKFTTGSQGATSINFQTGALYLAYSYQGEDLAYNTAGKLRCILTSAATGYEYYTGPAGEPCTPEIGTGLSGSIEAELMPNTDYYLWIFPNYTYYAVWGIKDCTVSTEGQYGTPSTITAADGYLGGEIPITLTRGLDSMKHTVEVSCAGVTQTLIKDSSEYPTIVWRPSLEDYAPHITEAAFAEAEIKVETFLNGHSLGNSSKVIRAMIPDTELLPLVSEGWARLQPYNEGAASGFKCYIQGYSRAEAVFDESKIDMSGTLGASVRGFEIKAGALTVNAAPFRTDILQGALTATCTLIDSRGRRISQELSASPFPYAKPAMTQVSVFRCDADGKETEDGYYYSAKATAVFSELGGENEYSLRTAWRTMQGSYGGWTDMVSGTAGIISGISPDGSFEVKIEIRDKLGNSTSAIRRLATRQWAMKFREDAKGLAFGKAPEFEKAVELPEDWEIRRGLEDKVLWMSGIAQQRLSIPAAGWAEGSCSIEAEVRACAAVFISVETADMTEAEAKEAEAAFGEIYRADVADGTLTFKAGKVPAADIPIKVVSIG